MFMQALADELGRFELRRRLEKNYFKRIGVDGRSAVYGLLAAARPLTRGAGGWTYRIADMELFGIDNVHWLGAGEYPPAAQLPLLGLVPLPVELQAED